MVSIKNIKVGDTLTIKKIAQLYDVDKNGHILTGHTNHPYCPYPKTTNSKKILTVDTKLKVVAKGKAQTKYATSYATAVYNNIQFDIFSTDLKRFCK